jgi:exopolysaccharide production protein ExoQ
MTTFAIEKQPSKPSFIATLIPKAEFAFCIMGLIFFSGAHNALTDYFLGESIGGLIGSLMRYLVILISFSLLVWRWPLTISVARRGLWIWVLFILQALSYFWSELPEWSYLSIRGELLPMALFGLYFGSRYSLKEQLKILIFFLSGSALASFLVVFLVPEIGRHPATEFEGAWRGIYGHKNGLSAFMSLTVLGFLSILLGRDKNKFISARFALIGLAITMSLIVLSTSLTGIILAIASLGILSLYRRYRWHGKRSVLALDVFAGLTIGIVSLVVINWNLIWETLGKDPTLTGRTIIWQSSLELWMKHRFLLGFGRDAFWNPDLPYAHIVGRNVAWQYVAPHAHNGFVDLVLEVGLVGLIIFLLGFTGTIYRTFRMAYIKPAPQLLWACGYLSLLIIFNFSESLVMRKSSFFFVIYMAIYLSVLLPERELADDT